MWDPEGQGIRGRRNQGRSCNRTCTVRIFYLIEKNPSYELKNTEEKDTISVFPIHSANAPWQCRRPCHDACRQTRPGPAWLPQQGLGRSPPKGNMSTSLGPDHASFSHGWSYPNNVQIMITLCFFINQNFSFYVFSHMSIHCIY